jgi:DNA-directed RNA polymerase alpha subunit
MGVAIDQVLFLQNTTPLPDEMLAHRLGLVPLVSRNVARGLRYTRVSCHPPGINLADGLGRRIASATRDVTTA